jgi:PD-(D/E)XK nuclease superfamily
MLIDRSRIEAYQICPRFRYLRYHYGGRGIVPAADTYYLGFGQLYHSALEQILKNPSDAPRIIRAGSDALERLITKAGARLLPSLQFPLEQQYLFEGLLFSYQVQRVQEILSTYSIVGLEEELLWPIGELPGGEPLIDMLRVDALLRDNSTDSLYYKEYKTTAYGDAKWAKEFENNSQVMANLKAIEDVKKERPAGVLIEGHVKGRRRLDTAKASRYSGTQIQDSLLCYAYELGSGYRLTWGPRSIRVGVWDLNYTPAAWVNRVLGPEERAGFFVSPPPISPDPYALDRWQRQTVAQERRIFLSLREIDSSDNEENQRNILDEVFPCHETSCIRYGIECDYYAICHNAPVREAPMEGGAYTARIPHHLAEREELQVPLEDDAPGTETTLDNPAQPG